MPKTLGNRKRDCVCVGVCVYLRARACVCAHVVACACVCLCVRFRLSRTVFHSPPGARKNSTVAQVTNSRDGAKKKIMYEKVCRSGWSWRRRLQNRDSYWLLPWWNFEQKLPFKWTPSQAIKLNLELTFRALSILSLLGKLASFWKVSELPRLIMFKVYGIPCMCDKIPITKEQSDELFSTFPAFAYLIHDSSVCRTNKSINAKGLREKKKKKTEEKNVDTTDRENQRKAFRLQTKGRHIVTWSPWSQQKSEKDKSSSRSPSFLCRTWNIFCFLSPDRPIFYRK